MLGAIVLLGLIILIAGMSALILYALKRRTDREFAVIGVTTDRRSVDLRKRGDSLEHARADAVLEKWTAERCGVRSRMRLIQVDAEPDYRIPEVFRRQAD